MKLRITSISIFISTLFYSQQLTIETRDNASITTAGTNSGFFQTHIPQNFPTGADGWWYLLDTRHGDPRYAMQLSGSFFNQDLWFRKIDPGIPNQPWSKVVLENPSGKVGINLGADLPREMLEINGNIRIGKSNNNSWVFHAPDDARHSLFIAPYLSTGVENWDKQTVFQDGNIAVNGKLEAKEIKVTQSPTADFVFEDNYNLPALEEVEKHIKAKKHLPEIASAKEMEKEGVNVGEFQIKLLQKIEELTLYSIEQNKQIKNQTERIQSLESENQQVKTLLKRIEKLEENTK